MTAAPTFAFIHEFIPAGQRAASDMARVPIETPPAPDTYAAPQK